ncbi:MAG: 4'-phosphopantetheinyl transferase superfamily protein [Verrucomicrobia bacterium]|jgi:phosphopantetheinyl transferase|nr:MAG: 4'-phosphopantetheinyl transferase superfamily protein [Verrucomicrobiota bacterium]MDH4470746.1 4'-phosphopantetheinyl transferase superfamily protein [Verrucomicrobiae bacterium]
MMNRVDFSLQSTKEHFSFHLPEKEIHIWLTRIFHTDRDEEAAKSDVATPAVRSARWEAALPLGSHERARQAGARESTQRSRSPYRPSQNRSLTQHPSGLPAYSGDRDEILGLPPLYSLGVDPSIVDKEEHSSDFSFFRKRAHQSQIGIHFLLSRYLELSPEQLLIQKTERGKPILASHPEISFSIAHSGDLLVLAFARHPIGIDLEHVRPVRGGAIAKKFFTIKEMKFLSEVSEEDFFYLWTAKEAALKADGCGITEGLREAITNIEEHSILGVDLHGRSISITPWFLKTTLKKDFIGAVASFVSPTLIRWYDCRSADILSI